MFIELTHSSEHTKESNYREFSTEEFEALVHSTAKDCNISDVPEILLAPIDHPGQCLISTIGDSHIPSALLFDIKVLSGDEYSIHQIDEIIRHELAHVIATRRFNIDCGHDSRWQEVARELGCPPSPTLCLIKNKAMLHVNIVEHDENHQNFSLLCSSCNSILHKGEEFSGPFSLFAISGANVSLPIMYGDLGIETSCCNTSYKFQGDAQLILDGLRRNGDVEDLQVYLENLIGEVTLERRDRV